MDMTVDDIIENDALPAIAAKDGAVPFPQANSVECILNLLLNTEDDGSTSASYIVRNVVNCNRQAMYYVNAAIYLGLCRKIGEIYYPTSEGLRVKRALPAERRHLLAAIMLSHPVIGRWYTRVFLHGTAKERLDFIATGFAEKLSPATVERRCQCVMSWISWIQKNLPEV